MLVLVVMGVLNLWLSISSVSILSSLDFSIVLNPYCHGGGGGGGGGGSWSPNGFRRAVAEKKILGEAAFY